MTPDDQMRAIAKTQGMPEIQNVVGRGWVYGFKDGENLREIKVPRYLEDLNAAHEFENTLTPKEQASYARRLAFHNRDDASVSHWIAAHAIAAERAEQFLKIKGLWVDERKPESKMPMESLDKFYPPNVKSS
jgi:hypothetical protein